MIGRSKIGSGFTLVELLVVIGIIALLAALLLPVLARATAQARSSRCKSRLGQVHKGIRMYLSNFEEYFPPAFQYSSATDLGGVAWHRFAIHEFCVSSYTHTIKPNPPTSEDEASEKFDLTRKFWQCPATGWTNDHFGPSLAFKIPGGEDSPAYDTAGYDGHAQESELVTQYVASTERPLLTDVDASYAKPDAEDSKEATNTGEHMNDLNNGWMTTTWNGIEVFVGAGDCLRTADNYELVSTRFDFRHNGSTNVLFIDGHVTGVRQDDTARLIRIYNRWDSLMPSDVTP